MSIAQYVKEDLRSRLRSGQPLPTELTLESLAGHYEVSFTPVRAAVAELIAEGMLVKGANRRLVAAPLAAQANGERGKLPPEALPEPPRDLLKVVEGDLIRMSLEGKAVFLREEAAAGRYGISRSAIRNIFHRLAGMGLLLHIPRRGWQVRPFRQEDMQAFNEIRELLELKALELAQPRLEPARIQTLLDGNRFAASDAEWPQIDNTFHAYIVEQAGNHYIRDFFERQGRYYEMLFDWEDLDREIATETVRQHRQILEAILRQDWQAARSALSWHIRCNHPILSTIMAKSPEQPRGEP
jgi:DNA-binding GntR family transcriptional regulator